MAAETILSIRNVSKRFGGTQALNGVSFDIQRGEVHAIMGENGAGKSTLVKIISAVISKDSGTISFAGKELTARNPQEARAAGISIVYQELSLSPYLSVGENISASASRMDTFHLMNTNQFDEDARRLLEINRISPHAIIRDLGVGAQQIVEIAGALSRKSSLLILDEPTSSLTLQEVEELFKIIQILKDNGVTIIYITHKIGEVFKIADRITVLKDGEYMGTLERASTNEEQVIQLMIGRDIKDMYPVRTGIERECVLEVKNISGAGFSNVSFKVFKGEIFGFAGLTGAGRTEMFTALFGVPPVRSGQIWIEGRPVEIRSPGDAMRHGIGYLSEDRKQIGLFLEMRVKHNTIAATIDQVSGRLFLNNARMTSTAQTMIQRMRTKVNSIEDKIFSLSGGNQQKVLLARWLLVRPKILIVDEPTRGIDVGAKQEVYQILRELAQEGIAVIMISSELPEILGMSDRIAAMYQGQVMTILEGDERTEELLAPAIVGIPRDLAAERVLEA